MGQVLTDQSLPEGATSEEPSAPAPVGQADLDKFKEEILGVLKSDFDQRFQGFQQIIAKRDSRLDTLENTLSELKTADLSDDERVQLEKEALAQERAAIAAERELLSLQSDFPEEIELYKQVIDQTSAKDQIALLRQWRETLTKQPANDPTPNDAGAEGASNQSVDPNNPAAQSTDGMDYEAQFERDPSLAEKILRGTPRLSSGN